MSRGIQPHRHRLAQIPSEPAMSARPRLPLLLLGAALLLSSCATIVTPPAPSPPTTSRPAPAPARPPVPARPAVCAECGTIVHIETVAAGKAQGAVLGGIVGSVASRPVAGDLDYKVHLRMDNGARTSVILEERGAWKINSRVRVVGGRLVAR